MAGDVVRLPGPAPTDRDPRLLPQPGDRLTRDGLDRIVLDLQDGPSIDHRGRKCWGTVSAHPSRILEHVTHVRYHGGDPTRWARVTVDEWLSWARGAEVLYAYDPCEPFDEDKAHGLLRWDRRAGVMEWTWGTFSYEPGFDAGPVVRCVLTPRNADDVLPLKMTWDRGSATNPREVSRFVLGLRCGLAADGEAARIWRQALEPAENVEFIRTR